MNKIIAVIAIVIAFTLGTVFSADIATAVKPITEVFVTNTDPIPVSLDPESPSSHPAVQFEVTGVQISSCDEFNTSGFTVITLIDGFVFWSGSIDASIHSVVITEDAFELEGIYTTINQGCIDDLRNFPALISITGDCGLGSTVTVRTEGGVDVSFTGNVACIP